MKPIFSNYFYDCLDKHLPRKIKRMIYVSSILALIDDIKTPDTAIIKKLNHIMGLSNTDEALVFPMYIHSFIWSKVVAKHQPEFTRIQTELHVSASSDYSGVVDFFCNNTPKWLRYGSYDLLKHDLRIIFNSLPVLTSRA